MWGFMGGRGGLPDKFEEQYHCYSAAMADKTHLEVSRCRFAWLSIFAPNDVMLMACHEP